MRGTIVGIFGVIVVLVTLLSFGLMRATIGDVNNQGAAQRAVTAGVAQLELNALRMERWLAVEAAGEAMQEPFIASSEGARSDAATTAADGVEKRASKAEATGATQPTLVVLFDNEGIVLGRNGSTLMRAEKLGERYPRMLKQVLAGVTSSDIWINQAKNEQLLASYAPIRNKEGAIVGGVAIGLALSNQRLDQISRATSEASLIAVTKTDGKLKAVAQTSGLDAAMLAAVPAAEGALGGAARAGAGGVIGVEEVTESFEGAAKAISGYGDGSSAALIAVVERRGIGGPAKFIGPILGVLLLGLVLTLVGARMVTNHISQPISDLEDGLLAIINGERDLRFELDHNLLGGLVSRINTLLNELLDVDEDNTDEQGRTAGGPASSRFVFEVDHALADPSAAGATAAGAALRDEDTTAYYARLFTQYGEAKVSVGSNPGSVTAEQFRDRIEKMERDLQQKHAKPFRYRVEVRDGKVVFVAVPLA